LSQNLLEFDEIDLNEKNKNKLFFINNFSSSPFSSSQKSSSKSKRKGQSKTNSFLSQNLFYDNF